ncbi:MAG: BMP family ABC transporter substrate-binding protein [Solobacterium sp.]|jgi:basic membrane protein A|nr:BMP family ABC transporter substrate-binding protein [Solobacterium sp.]
MKKVLSLTLAALMSLSLAGCGGGSSSAAATSAAAASEAASEAPAETAAAAASSSDMKVAMITDYGDITDKSFNQTTYEASKAFCEDNGIEFEYKKPASDADADREASIEDAIAEGYNVIVMPGFAFAQAIADEAPLYPDVKFVALDVAKADLDKAAGGTFSADNVYSAVYQEELAGYMAGYAAVKLGYTKLGFLGGMAVPSVVRYGSGYVQGANEAAKELGNTADVEVKYIYGGQFYGDADITSVMDTWYQGGTEIVFACGGGIYSSAAEAAVKTGGKVIGVDVDQAATIDGDYGDGITVTSAMKGLAATVNTLLSAIRDGKWDEYKGKVETLGIVSDNPSENYVQLPDSTQWGDGFTEDDYKQLVADMHSGKITVDNSIDALPSVEITVDDQGSIKG